ncbi:hypothetical protein [Psychromonas hadalis]|uniref:hypothetical protein n=1 Tax=Psychromonas hadalis TaxID=211669 RepID=UPI0003B7790F|nr:hypothetical protein [Psychromonas hadalis]
MELIDHLEVMEHELGRIPTTISSSGYRVDGETGIKTVVSLSARRSVDYFFEIKGKCQFLEFTDLARGQEDLLGIDDPVGKIENEFHRNKLKKLLKQDSRRELVEKFKDSKDIFSKISNIYQNVPNIFLNLEAKVFYIVHAPINSELSDVDKASITRYLLILKSTVSDCLEDEICERVKLILLDKFIEEMG